MSFCKTCNQEIDKTIPYCSADCIVNNKEFFTLCENASSIAEVVRATGIPETSLRKILKELNIFIKFVPKKKEPKIKTCPKCGKEHTSKYGIHCSRSCANGRIHSEKTKEKIRKSTYKFREENPQAYEDLKKLNSERMKTKWKDKEYRELKMAQLKKYGDSVRKPHKEKRAVNNARSARYKMSKIAATPSDADLWLIKTIYINTPEGYTVDHIIPINKGGLHHQDNLQYLTQSENSKKKDRLDYEPQSVIRWQDIVQLTEN